MNRLDELTVRLIQETIQDDELLELQQLLSDDPTALDDHILLRQVEAALSGRGRQIDVTAATMKKLDGEGSKAGRTTGRREARPRRRMWTRPAVLGVAGSLLLVVAFGVVHVLRKTRIDDGFQVVAVQTEAGVGTSIERARPVPPQVLEEHGPHALFHGDTISVPGGSSVTVTYDDGTKVAVAGQARIQIQPEVEAEDKHGKLIQLDFGQLTATIRPQPSSLPMVFRTPAAHAVVLGTELTVDAESESTRLQVVEGRVRLVRGHDEQSIDVEGGHYAVARRGHPLVARAMPTSSVAARVTVGLVALYRFDEGGGRRIRDVSAAEPSLDMTISAPDKVEWIRGGGLRFRPDALARSLQPATKIFEACRKTGQLTVEAWVKPDLAGQVGPTRIVTMSENIESRNFTLAQGEPIKQPPPERDFYVFRLRTTTRGVNGMPELKTPDGSATTELTHLAYTVRGDGSGRFFVNGQQVASDVVAGDFSNWSNEFPLAFGNELSMDRSWIGEMHLVAIYNRGLSDDEIKQNLRAGVTQLSDEGVR